MKMVRGKNACANDKVGSAEYSRYASFRVQNVVQGCLPNGKTIETLGHNDTDGVHRLYGSDHASSQDILGIGQRTKNMIE